MDMPTIPLDDFLEHLNDDDFFQRFGNPVLVHREQEIEAVYMAREYYERLAKEMVDIKKQLEDDVLYWIYEIWMPDEKKKKLEVISAKLGFTPEEYLVTALRAALSAQEWLASAHTLWKEEPNKDCDIKLVRFYPVHRDETEGEALRRALREEEHEHGSNTPDAQAEE